MKCLLESGGFDFVVEQQSIENKWFTKENCYFALYAIAKMLDEKSINKFFNKYDSYFRDAQQRKCVNKTVAVISAGNIPCAAFHDFFCILASGNKYMGKLSKQDSLLLPFIAKLLLKINPKFKNKIVFTNELSQYDKVIATGSDNSSRYFEYYFKEKPLLLRKNRNSIAILNGNETKEQLKELSVDVFQYFGLGCRSVSKIYVPQNYDFTELIEIFRKSQNKLMLHNGYVNNYEYHRCIYAMNNIPFFDGNSFLLTQNESINSPISVIYYEEYESVNDILSFLKLHKNEIQCVVSSLKEISGCIGFGQSQYPSLLDYPDNRDTVLFCNGAGRNF